MTQTSIRRTLTAGTLALALTLTPVQAKKTTYRDVDDGIWYAPYVAFCQQHGLMEGRTSSAFSPEELMTRADLTQALYCLAGRPDPAPAGEGGEHTPEETPSETVAPEESPSEENAPEEDPDVQTRPAPEECPFSDVGPDHPNYQAICWAKATGVIGGYPSGAFGPEDPITREQLAVLLWSSWDRPGAQAAPFADREEISDWSRAAVDWAFAHRLMTGTPANEFQPLRNTSRAEGAAIVTGYARAFYGLEAGYPLPEPRTLAPNSYQNESYVLDELGYLSYTGGFFRRGVDVSSHQKEIDWARVAAAGMDFAMIRAGYRGYTLGTINKDPYFDYNIQNALANGLEVGVYFYSQALTPAEAEEEAYQLLEWMGDYKVTYPVVFDWEEVDRDDSRSQNTDGNTVTACALAFCRVLEEAGYRPMTYGSPSKIYKGGLALEYLQDYPFWLAHYTKDTAPTSFRYHYDMWQYSSSGRVDGIQGDVDLNICLTDLSGTSPEKPVPPDEIPPPDWLGIQWD